MVLEKLFVPNWVEKRPLYSFFLGLIFPLIAFGTSLLLFSHTNVRHFIGVATILFTVIIALPGIIKLLSLEEKIETKAKGSFLQEHEGIFDFYIYFFIGVFVVFFIIAIFSPDLVFSQERLYGITLTDAPAKNLPKIFSISDKDQIFGIFKNNIYVMIVSFILSLFYGSGALFIITLNASIFASALSRIVRISIAGMGISEAILFGICQLGIMFLHGLPELASYFLAAIAGGVLSKAVTNEKFMSKNFKSVLGDAILLMLISLSIVATAAVLEVLISKRLFLSDICTTVIYPIIILLIAIVWSVVWLERRRLKL